MFPGRDSPIPCAFARLDEYSRAKTLSEAAIDAVAEAHGVKFPADGLAKALGKRRKRKLAMLQEAREQGRWDDAALADDFARAVFGERLADQEGWTSEFAPTL